MQPAQRGRNRRDSQARVHQSQVMAFARTKHHAVFAEFDRLRIAIHGEVAHRQKRHQDRLPLPEPTGTFSLISSVITVKLSRNAGPKVIAMATSDASRPRAIRTRPIRGMLLRGSKMYQRPPK